VLADRAYDVGRLVEQGSHPPVTDLGDATDIVDLAGLVASRDQAKIGTKVARATEAARIVDGCGEGERGELTDAGMVISRRHASDARTIFFMSPSMAAIAPRTASRAATSPRMAPERPATPSLMAIT